MSLATTKPRTRIRGKTTAPPARSVTMADLDALGSVAIDLEATDLFLGFVHYVDEGARRENQVEILLEAATAALRNARATFEEARRALGQRLTRRGRQ